jgi:hypothetical protein
MGEGARSFERVIPRVGLISRATIRAAMAQLQREYGFSDIEAGFTALQEASQMHNIKLRSVAAALVAGVSAPESDPQPAAEAPHLPFAPRAQARQPNRTHVLQDLMRSATELAGSDRGAVLVRDPVQGGLMVEGAMGFDRSFVDFFSYVDDNATASGATVVEKQQVYVADVSTSPIYRNQDRANVLAAGIHSVLSTPLLDDDGLARGAVTTHFAERNRELPADVLRRIQGQADECARWLAWYDDNVVPTILATVHAAARAVAGRDGRRIGADLGHRRHVTA